MSAERSQLIYAVDDDEAVRDSFMLALADDPYEVQTFGSGDEALDATARRRPDLIFLDLKMAGKDGVKTLRELLALDPSLRIYVVTAFAEEYMTSLRQARKQGMAFQLVAKPVTDDQIRMIATATLG